MDNLNDVRNQIGTLSEEYFSIMDQVVNSYSEELDTYIDNTIRPALDSDVADLSINQLSNFALSLSTLIYTVGSHVEKTGVLEDISKLIKQETYNNAYMDAQSKAEEQKSKLTVAQLTAIAEEGSKYETTMNSIYSRTYKQLKFKLDSALELLSTIKKIISQKVQEMSLNNLGDSLANYAESTPFSGGMSYGN